MNNTNSFHKILQQNVDLDLTEIFKAMLATLDDQKDVHVLHESLVKISEHQIELSRGLSEVFQSFANRLPAILQQRVDDYTSSLKAEKLLRFRYMSSIKEEAVEKGWRDVEKMIAHISLLRAHLLTEVEHRYREMFTLLGHTLVELALRRANPETKMDLKNLGRLLGGQTD